MWGSIALLFVIVSVAVALVGRWYLSENGTKGLSFVFTIGACVTASMWWRARNTTITVYSKVSSSNKPDGIPKNIPVKRIRTSASRPTYGVTQNDIQWNDGNERIQTVTVRHEVADRERDFKQPTVVLLPRKRTDDNDESEEQTCPKSQGNWEDRKGTCMEQHDNGGRPTTSCLSNLNGPGECVVWLGGTFEAHRHLERSMFAPEGYSFESEAEKNPSLIVKKFKYQRAFTSSGRGSTDEWTWQGTDYDGSVILLHLKGTRYALIGGGAGIVEFDTDGHAIESFECPVGNNDVPYAWAVSKSTVYFFAEMEKAPIEALEGRHPSEWYDVVVDMEEGDRKSATPIEHVTVMGRECAWD